MGVYSRNHTFKASENNSYADYFQLYDDWGDVVTNKKTSTDVYKEHLQTASKNKLIDIAIEGYQNYEQANNLAHSRGLEIDDLKKEVTTLTNEVTLYNNIAYNSKVACFVTIGVCALVVGVFYIYQYIKFRLKKYADKIRTETIEELRNK